LTSPVVSLGSKFCLGPCKPKQNKLFKDFYGEGYESGII
jgi:hypothetical protein